MAKKSLNKKICLEDFHFSIVKMDVNVNGKYKCIDKEENKNQMKLTYYLLVDDDNFIHDYKVQVKEFFITQDTTKSHNVDNPPPRLVLRKNILERLKLQHYFSNDNDRFTRTGYKKKVYKHINNKMIEDSCINELLWSTWWKDITFQNIQYLFTGSNPSGEGNGKSSFTVKYAGKDYVFGFFMQLLNVSKDLKKYELEYKTQWGSVDEIDRKAIDFSEWISKDKDIFEYFTTYSNESRDWESLTKKYKERTGKKKQRWLDINKKITSLRAEFVNKFDKLMMPKNKKTFNNIKLEVLTSEVYRKFFGIEESPNNFEHAHIKPVWQIRKEYMETKNEEILKDISNEFNCLPLPPTIHKDYDDYLFYWDESGKIKLINTNMRTNELKGFEQINPEMLKDISRFIKEYIDILKQQNKI